MRAMITHPVTWCVCAVFRCLAIAPWGHNIHAAEGDLDEVTIFSTVLTPEQISYIADAALHNRKLVI